MIDEFSVDCTGNACAGDEITFREAVYGGSFRKPLFRGHRMIAARILRDSYGQLKGQHTFTLEVLASQGVDPLQEGQVIKRKGRNIYREGTRRKRWADEAAREVALQDKYARRKASVCGTV